MNRTRMPSRLGFRLPFTVGLNEIFVTLWVCASFYIMIATGGGILSLMFLPLIAGPFALVFLAYKKPVIATVPAILSVGVLLLNFSILASYLFNSERYDPVYILGNIVSSMLLFYTLYTITMRLEVDFRKTLIVQSIFISAGLPIVLATSTNMWGRLVPATLQPNYIGMMALLAFVGALAARGWIAKGLLSALPVYTMLAMQSRASLMSAVLAVVIIGGIELARLPAKKRRYFILLALLFVPMIGIGLTLAGFPVLGYAGNMFEGVFMLNDEHRGIDSGGSGRTELWSAAINLWLSHPLFGVGFKGHQLMMPEQMYAHNAYLGVLADIGIVGFASYLLIIGVAIYNTLKRESRALPEFPLRAAIILTYIVYGMLESRAFSFGNSYSLIFLLVAFDCSKVRRKAVVRPKLSQAAPWAGAGKPGSPMTAGTLSKSI